MPSLASPAIAVTAPASTSPASAAPALAMRFWLAHVAAFAVLALAIMWSRWGGTIEDSLAYFTTAQYLRGDAPASALRAPFPYRMLMPALAALLPGELHNSFARLNWLCVVGAACAMALTAARLGLDKRRVAIAGLLVIVSVPTFWYAPYLLTDPGSNCARAVFVLGVLAGQPWLAAGAGIVASAIREENIVLLVWLMAMRRIAIVPGLAALACAGAWMLYVRWVLVAGLPPYTWTPHWQTALAALQDVRSLASIALAVGVVVPLAALGWRLAPARLAPLKSLLLLMVLPPLYAALCVRVDGRAVWGLYPMLIPFALYGFARPAPAAASAA